MNKDISELIAGETIESPSWEQVQAALLALDNRQKTVMALSFGLEGSAVFMEAGGGSQNRVWVGFYDEGSDLSFTLMDPQQTEPVDLILKGLPDAGLPYMDCPSSAAGISLALRALRYFFEHRQRDPDLIWKDDDADDDACI